MRHILSVTLTCAIWPYFCQPIAASLPEVSALRQQVKELMERIDALEKNQKEITPDSAIQATGTSPKQKANLKLPANVTRERPESPLSLKISGHVNRGIWYASNGAGRNVGHVDNDNSPTRLRIVGSGQWDEKTEIGAILELGIETGSTDEVAVNNFKDNRTGPNIRHADLYIKHKDYGELYLGEGSTATDGIVENTDLSKTTLLSAGGSQSFIAGATVYTDATTGLNASPDGEVFKPDRVMDPGDGGFRQNRLRYNSPAFMGLSVQASHFFAGRSNNWDIILKYGATIRDIVVRVQTGFLQNNNITRTSTFAGEQTGNSTVQAPYNQFHLSAGLLFPNGISLFGSMVNRSWFVTDADGTHYNVRNGTNYVGKLGYQFDYFEAGKTALAIDFGRSEGMYFNLRNLNAVYTGTAYGIFATQFLDRIATELYAGYRHFKVSSNIPDNHFNDIFAFLVGARVKL